MRFTTVDFVTLLVFESNVFLLSEEPEPYYALSMHISTDSIRLSSALCPVGIWETFGYC